MGFIVSENQDSTEEVHKNLHKLTINNGYQIIQSNGQRIYEPKPSLFVTLPPKGCEVFIGCIPKFIYEDKLIPLFETIGPLYKFRMMLDFAQKTRGYAFATYFSKEHANEAIRLLHGYQLTRTSILKVYKSVDNRRLFIGNIPPDRTANDVRHLFERFDVGTIVDVILHEDWHDHKLNRGFAFVEFDSHVAASMARRQFHPRHLLVWGRELFVDWADPLPEVDQKTMAQVSVLFLKNLPVEFSGEQFRAIIEGLVTKGVTKVHKVQNYAFVHFLNRPYAEYAFGKLKDTKIADRPITVEWARPKQFCVRNRLPPSNFCTSVPLHMRRLVRDQKNHTYHQPL